MDGNGRWAQSRGYERTYGHLRGARVAKQIIEACATRGVNFLTLYAFSTENWMRPKTEVAFLMQLLARHFRKERKNLMKKNIRVQTIGDIDRLPESVAAEVQKTVSETAGNTGMTLIFALSYGSRQELTQALQKIAAQVQAGKLNAEDICEEWIERALQTANTPDPDLIIRTSGEYRLSNFMLWQAAYSELYISDTFWPNFNQEELDLAFEAYANRERRYGKVSPAPYLQQVIS
jgi:undecaprenyl diphosphate synthase